MSAPGIRWLIREDDEPIACGVCGELVPVNTSAEFTDGNGWCHVSCAEGRFNTDERE